MTAPILMVAEKADALKTNKMAMRAMKKDVLNFREFFILKPQFQCVWK